MKFSQSIALNFTKNQQSGTKYKNDLSLHNFSLIRMQIHCPTNSSHQKYSRLSFLSSKHNQILYPNLTIVNDILEKITLQVVLPCRIYPFNDKINTRLRNQRCVSLTCIYCCLKNHVNKAKITVHNIRYPSVD